MSSSGLSVGIIGLPNAGKSTLFNALLKKQQALVANYPFTTIEPNIGVVPVTDKRLTEIAKIIGSEKNIKATIKFVDIAGLVKGAHQGEGLGNKFLAHIREVDLICHVLRAFEDPNIAHISEKVEPEKDKDIVETELILADLQTLNKQQEPKYAISNLEQQRSELILLLKQTLNQNKSAREMVITSQQQELLKDFHLLSAKPVIYVYNIAEGDIGKVNPNLPDAITISAKIEAELASFSHDEEKEYLKQLGISASGLDRLIKLAYQKLGLITFYSGNQKETHAWPIKIGSIALVAAGTIHSDFKDYFIKAEVVKIIDFVKYKGWLNSHQQGKVQIVGKDYLIEDGDIINFKIGK